MNLRIAISVARLEHVTRGVETWARDTFDALRLRGLDVTLFKGSGRPEPHERVLGSIKKGSRLSRLIIALRPGFTWRFGLGSADNLEETTFALSLLRALRREPFDIVHMQDAHVANVLRVAAERGWIRTKVILGHGTEESTDFLCKLPYVQHLAPYHMEEALRERDALMRETGGWIRDSRFVDSEFTDGRRDSNRRIDESTNHEPPISNPHWFAVPNFVDTDVFRPPRFADEKRACRRELGLPEDAFVVLSVAAIKKGHKRVDYLIREVASLDDPRIHLLVAGAHEAETDELMQLAATLMGDRAHLLCDLKRDRMPRVFRAADVFALCSLKEMMPIALLEAIASGLPSLVHRYPVEQWMIGPGGMGIDMARDGTLSLALASLVHDRARHTALATHARGHAVATFSKDAVIDQILDMYDRVAGP